MDRRVRLVLLLVIAATVPAALGAGSDEVPTDFALHFNGSGGYIEIVTPDHPASSVGDDATLELMFKPASCQMQALLAQRYHQRSRAGATYAGPDLQAQVRAAMESRNSSSLRGVQAKLGDVLSFMRSQAGNGSATQPGFHGRGIMVGPEGDFVAWSRDGAGVWRGMTLGKCEEGRWTHVALVQQDNVLFGYLHSKLVKRFAMEGSQAGRYAPYYTVARSTDGKAAVAMTANGTVDEVRVWARALSAQEVRCGADRSLRGPNRGLLAYLRLDDAAGVHLKSAATVSGTVATVRGQHVWRPSRAVRQVTVAPDALPDGMCADPGVRTLGAGIHMARMRQGEECPDACSGRGACDARTGTCFCYTGYVGLNCAKANFPGYALYFDEAGQHVAMQPMGRQNSLTLEAWVRPHDVSGTRVLRADRGAEAGKVRWGIQDGHVFFAVAGNEPERHTFKYEVQPDTWVHLAVAYSKRHANRTGTGSATLYVNGDVAETLGFARTQAAQLGDAWVGADPAGGGFFVGHLDELRVWGRVYPPHAMARRANGRLHGTEVGLLAYYRFDEGTGRVAVDAARAGNESAPGLEHAVASSFMGMPLDAFLGGQRDGHDGASAEAAPAWVESTAPIHPCPRDCLDRGRCWNGTCRCDQWYGGRTCEVVKCPNFCSGHGRCVLDEGVLDVEELSRNVSAAAAALAAGRVDASVSPRLGDSSLLSRMLANLTSDLAGHAADAVKQHVQHAVRTVLELEQPKKCVCDAKYSGPDCSYTPCPKDCSGHGACVNGTCSCARGWSGEECATPVCPDRCSGHGECVSGLCTCDYGWTGIDCAERSACQSGCSGHGVCLDGVCECDHGFTGEECEWSTSCPNFCSGRGRCVNDKCKCDRMFSGPDCSDVRCPRDCSGHGDCMQGLCSCEPGWTADDCSQSALWPMRCVTLHKRGKTETHCMRGWVSAPTIGSQVLEMQYADTGMGQRTFTGKVREVRQPTVEESMLFSALQHKREEARGGSQ